MSQLRRVHRPGLKLSDLTALVDIALTLVVFLLLGSRATESEGLPVALPGAETGAALTGDPLNVVITADGEVVIHGRSRMIDDLAEHIAAGQRVVLQADRQCPHGRVVAVLDAARAAGAGEVVYATEGSDGVIDF